MFVCFSKNVVVVFCFFHFEVKKRHLSKGEFAIFVWLLQKVSEARESQREYYEKELIKLQTRLEGEAAQLKEAHSKTLEELAWKHHTAIEAAHSNANKDKKKLQIVSRNSYAYSKHKRILNLAHENWYNLNFVLADLLDCCCIAITLYL